MSDQHLYIICHMMTSLDGKIASGEEKDILGDYFNLYMQTEGNYKSNSWLLGRVTMQMFASKEDHKLPEDFEEIEETNFIAEPVSNYYLFGIDTKGILRWNKNTVKFENVDDELNLIIVVTRSTPKNYLSYLRSKNISYIFAGEDEIDFENLFATIKKDFKIDTLLLEGGGLINGSVLAAGFIDEISLLLTPIVVNRSKAPSLFERSVDEELNIKKFTLFDIQKLELDCVLLRYKKISY